MKTSILYISLLAILCSFAACNKDDDNAAQSPDGLAVAESKTVEVMALEKWNDTGIEIWPGETLSFVTTGEWTDWMTVCDADGYSDVALDPFSGIKRVPDAEWFELIAAVDTARYFIIGSDTSIRFPEGGQLSLFANDAPLFYGNNSGSVSTVINRVE